MTKKIFLIAGEKSGDDIGYKLMKSLINLDPSLKFLGIGGPLMSQCGLKSIFPYEDLSVMGFVEVLPKIFALKARIKETVADILKAKPDLIITIDLPGFNYRVVNKLREQGYKGKIFHYVAPSVWAYKEGRAAKFAKIFDRMICILPFEEKYFQAVGLKTNYFGNPVIEQDEIAKHEPNKNASKILVCCGSRIGEIKRLLPIFAASLDLLSTDHQFEASILTQPSYVKLVSNLLKESRFKYKIITPKEDDKIKLMAKCDLALTKSGTITTEIALAGVPMIVAHKVNWLSYLIIKTLIKISSICLVNLIAGEKIIPELIQGQCTPYKIAGGLEEYINDPVLRKAQAQQSTKIFKILGQGQKESPSLKLARLILKELADAPAS